jgi:hypothetical protein
MSFQKTPRMDTSGFRHGLRVRMGATGPKGMLLKCLKKDGSGHYWKVRLQSGEWVWPEGFILDGVGDQVAVCEQCALPFMTTKVGGGLLCDRCDEDMYGTRARAAEPPDDLIGRAQRDQRRRH